MQSLPKQRQQTQRLLSHQKNKITLHHLHTNFVALIIKSQTDYDRLMSTILQLQHHADTDHLQYFRCALVHNLLVNEMFFLWI